MQKAPETECASVNLSGGLIHVISSRSPAKVPDKRAEPRHVLYAESIHAHQIEVSVTIVTNANS
jgi:hypothetical protein